MIAQRRRAEGAITAHATSAQLGLSDISRVGARPESNSKFVGKESGEAFPTVVDQLPMIDDHALVVDAPATNAWKAVLDEIDRATAGPLAIAYAHVIGCKPPLPSGTR